MKRRRLVTVEIAPGRFAKMYAEDAAKRVVVGREDKRRASSELRVKSEELADDLTSIVGIGPTAKAELARLGITTLAQLRAVDLSEVPARIRRAIEVWRG